LVRKQGTCEYCGERFSEIVFSPLETRDAEYEVLLCSACLEHGIQMCYDCAKLSYDCGGHCDCGYGYCIDCLKQNEEGEWFCRSCMEAPESKTDSAEETEEESCSDDPAICDLCLNRDPLYNAMACGGRVYDLRCPYSDTELMSVCDICLDEKVRSGSAVSEFAIIRCQALFRGYLVRKKGFFFEYCGVRFSEIDFSPQAQARIRELMAELDEIHRSISRRVDALFGDQQLRAETSRRALASLDSL